MRLCPWLIASLIATSFIAGWMIQGWRKDSVIADLIAKEEKANAQAAITLASEIAKVRQDEAAARLALQQRAAQLQKEKDDAKADRDHFIAGVRSGAIRLSIPVRAHGSSTTPGDTAITSGSDNQTRAELAPAAAQFLDAIASEGDDAIRQLNACIDSYNIVRENFHVQAP